MSSVATKCDSISTLLRRIVDEVTSQGDIATTQTIQDDYSRLSIWTADIGALHETDHPLSVESRLMDHHEILSHTYTILDDLTDVVFDLEQITSGQREARVATAVEVKHSGEILDDTVRDERIELVEEVDSCIKRLFRVSRLIREAAPSDVFIKALSRKRYHFDDQYDISHVKHKYPKLSGAQAMWLSNRLGRAITQRRCYLSYVRDHGDKLASDSREEKFSSADMTFSPSHPLIPNSTLPPPSTFLTKASTIGPVKNFATRVDEPSDSEDDTKSYTTVSQSIALPAKSILQSRIPTLDSLPAIEGFREVKCPFCYRLRKFKNEKAWRQHVFSDLRTYVCTFQHCSAPLFKDLNEWFEHEMREHRPSYHCIVCSGQEFRAQSRFISHIERQHPVLLENSAKELVLQISKKALRDIPAAECPFCSNWEEQLRAKMRIAERQEISIAQSDEIHVTPSVFKRHVAAHLEELALFALPAHSSSSDDFESAVPLVDEIGHMSLGSKKSELSFESLRPPSVQEATWTSRLVFDQTMPQFPANDIEISLTSSATNIPGTSTGPSSPRTPNAVTSSARSSDMDADVATPKDPQQHREHVDSSASEHVAKRSHGGIGPPYFFRIDEIRESTDPNAPVSVSHCADWMPPDEANGHSRVAGGVSGTWWYCDGRKIRAAPNGLPQESRHYKTYSMYFSDGYGFWVQHGDALMPSQDATWQPLRFDHDPDDNYSSYLCNVAGQRLLLCRRSNQHWPKMLLPDINHGNNVTTYSQYGALKGELPIFLGLIAFTMKPDRLATVLPVMFSNGAWQTFTMPHGREDGRGVVVYVYTCPTGSSKADLAAYEAGKYQGAKYYY